MTRRRERHLVVFARAPRLGTVKRRLAAGIGAAAALQFYRTTLESQIRRLARDRRWTTVLAVTPDCWAARRGGWPTAGRPPGLLPQGRGDLGARMARALGPPSRGLPRGPAVIVGSDIPGIRPRHIAAAFRALGRHDWVFGPAADGGYWLVGARRQPPRPVRLFDRVRWSGPHALADTLAALRPGETATLLETLDDIDDAADWHRWRNRTALQAAAV